MCIICNVKALANDARPINPYVAAVLDEAARALSDLNRYGHQMAEQVAAKDEEIKWLEKHIDAAALKEKPLFGKPAEGDTDFLDKKVVPIRPDLKIHTTPDTQKPEAPKADGAAPVGKPKEGGPRVIVIPVGSNPLEFILGLGAGATKPLGTPDPAPSADATNVANTPPTPEQAAAVMNTTQPAQGTEAVPNPTPRVMFVPKAIPQPKPTWRQRLGRFIAGGGDAA